MVLALQTVVVGDKRVGYVIAPVDHRAKTVPAIT